MSRHWRLAGRDAGKILPRHLQIIFEINDYFLKTMQEHYPDDIALLSRTSIIDESSGRRVRMAWLAVVVSHKVNGVSELHSRLMVESLFADFANLSATLTNVTNGVTPRRWLAAANRPCRSTGPPYRPDTANRFKPAGELGNIRIIRWLTTVSAAKTGE